MNGRISYDAKKSLWKIDAAPHIAIRLKRVFGKVAKGRQGTITLSDTEENARDLEWFLERYPLEIDDRERLASRASQHRERLALVDALLSRKVPPPTFDLAIPPRDYQREAAALVLATGGLLLADDLGTGKTVSAICMLAEPRALPALVVTLTHLPRQWDAEIRRFAPKLRTHILKSTKPYDLCEKKDRGAQLALPGALPDVIITSYSKLSGWGETLGALGLGSVIFDEIQELRNMGGGGKPVPQKYEAAKHIADSASYRLGLSATPIYNNGIEFYAVLNVLRPDALGSKGEFREEWCEGGDRIEAPPAFGAYTREAGLMLRRTRKDVGRELPPLTKVVHEIDANTDALDAVSEACAELARAILAEGESERGAKLRASEELSVKLRQATGIAKAPFAAEFVKMLAESGEKVLVFAWHREVYAILNDRLKDLHPVMYTGTESPAQKDEARRAFVDGNASVMLMSLRSGAGLDGLQKTCRTVVFAELDWSPGVHEQGTGRVHRDDQSEPVVAYYLIADSGSDPIVVDVLGLKREQIEGVRNPDSELVEKLEVDDQRIRRLAAFYLAQRGLPVPEQKESAA